MKKTSYKVALGGVIASVAVFIMFTTGLAPFLTYVAPMFAGTLMIIIFTELSFGWAFTTYAAISVLSFLITPDREAALLFIFFFGYYPIVKALIEKLRLKTVQFILKLLCFNVSTILCYLVIINVFGMTEVFDSLSEFGQYSLLIFLGAANVVFVIYDLFLNSCKKVYTERFRTRFLRKK